MISSRLAFWSTVQRGESKDFWVLPKSTIWFSPYLIPQIHILPVLQRALPSGFRALLLWPACGVLICIWKEHKWCTQEYLLSEWKMEGNVAPPFFLLKVFADVLIRFPILLFQHLNFHQHGALTWWELIECVAITYPLRESFIPLWILCLFSVMVIFLSVVAEHPKREKECGPDSKNLAWEISFASLHCPGQITDPPTLSRKAAQPTRWWIEWKILLQEALARGVLLAALWWQPPRDTKTDN